ncbi:MAG: GTP-binding protein [Pseudomonadota bacterium]
MRMRNFTAGSLPEAMEEVRNLLGPDAAILSTEELKDGRVRVTAAVDSDPDDRLSSSLGAAARTAQNFQEAFAYHRLPDDLQEHFLAAAGDVAGLSPDLALAGAFEETLRFATLPGESGNRGRTYMLVGPPGAGKTSTTAKLCARRLLNGRKSTIITLDHESAGAREQVETYAKALKTPLRQASDPDSLLQAVTDCPAEHGILIDSIGVNPFDDMECNELMELREAAGAEVVLVLPAGGDALENAEVAQAFAVIGARYLIASRLDTARRYGGLLAACAAAQLSLMGAGISPSIGTGLSALTPLSLARLLLPEMDADLQDLSTGTAP